MSGAMRQLEERQLPAEVTIMRWSPKMDLLAVANKKGLIDFEIRLYIRCIRRRLRLETWLYR